MAFRPDAPAATMPALLTEHPIVSLSTDTEPSVGADGGELRLGETWFHEDTGGWRYWTGSAWAAVSVEQADGLKVSLLLEIRDRLDSILDVE